MSDIQNTAPVAQPAKLTRYVDLAFFKPYLAKWPTQWAGQKPTLEHFATALLVDPKNHKPGLEVGHIAMALREGGCTVQQFTTAFSCGPANNHRRALVNARVLKCEVVGKPYAYVLTVTPKGEAVIAKRIAALEAAAVDGEAKGKAKLKKQLTKRAKRAVNKGRASAVTSDPATTLPAGTENAPAATAEPVTAIVPVTDQPQA